LIDFSFVRSAAATCTFAITCAAVSGVMSGLKRSTPNLRRGIDPDFHTCAARYLREADIPWPVIVRAVAALDGDAWPVAVVAALYASDAVTFWSDCSGSVQAADAATAGTSWATALSLEASDAATRVC
jgi:hypothetical protein